MVKKYNCGGEKGGKIWGDKSQADFEMELFIDDVFRSKKRKIFLINLLFCCTKKTQKKK